MTPGRAWMTGACLAILALPLPHVLAAARPAQAPVQVAQRSAQASQATVKAVQEELARKGYKVGQPDGVMGARTRTAIRAYQRGARLPVTGEPSTDLLEHMRSSGAAGQGAATAQAAAEPPAGRSAPATRGGRDLVIAIQRELQVRGYYAGTLDGGMGAATRTAIRAFQRDAGFPVTGEADQRLLAELRVVDASIRAGRRN